MVKWMLVYSQKHFQVKQVSCCNMGVELGVNGSIHMSMSIKEILLPFDIQIFGPDSSERK